MDHNNLKEMIERAKKEKERLEKMDYTEYVAECGKGDCIDELVKIRKNVIPLRFEAYSENDIPVGASKSGGYPDLPPTISYPTFCGYTETRTGDGQVTHYNESAMQLVAQINLLEVTEYDRDNKLPKSGMLYFFWSGELPLSNNKYVSYLFEGNNTQVFKVIYYGGDLSLLKRTMPTMPYYAKYFDKAFDPCRILANDAKYMYDSNQLEDIFYDEGNKDIAGTLYEAYEKWAVEGDKLLGYFTGSMNVTGPADNGMNLLQYNYSSGCLWGIYWFISEKDLDERNFDEVYMNWDMD
ncbi:MAG TPA: DUF1963 domain-containing protein [Clostridiales bacterium]|nr:DUF1963 domain-containing protein [Clostridiales bacterium]